MSGCNKLHIKGTFHRQRTNIECKQDREGERKMTEEELRECLQRLEHGDKEAFTLLHNTIRQQVYGTVSLLVNRPH